MSTEPALRVDPSHIQVHLLESCPNRIVPCEFECGIATLTAGHRALHYTQECPNTTCGWGCGAANLLYKDREEHMASCPFRVVECSYSCGVQGLRLAQQQVCGLWMMLCVAHCCDCGVHA